MNDGRSGASWISNSPDSWIKIDLGHVRTINTVTFGRDRLGNLNDGDPGQFVVAVAISDNVYSDGNSSNDFMEYTQVYDSEKDGRARWTAHTAFPDPTSPPNARPRESIEIRTLAFF